MVNFARKTRLVGRVTLRAPSVAPFSTECTTNRGCEGGGLASLHTSGRLSKPGSRGIVPPPPPPRGRSQVRSGRGNMITGPTNARRTRRSMINRPKRSARPSDGHVPPENAAPTINHGRGNVAYRENETVSENRLRRACAVPFAFSLRTTSAKRHEWRNRRSGTVNKRRRDSRHSLILSTHLQPS